MNAQMQMFKVVLLVFIALLFTGCATYTGPSIRQMDRSMEKFEHIQQRMSAAVDRICPDGFRNERVVDRATNSNGVVFFFITADTMCVKATYNNQNMPPPGIRRQGDQQQQYGQSQQSLGQMYSRQQQYRPQQRPTQYQQRRRY